MLVRLCGIERYVQGPLGQVLAPSRSIKCGSWEINGYIFISSGTWIQQVKIQQKIKMAHRSWSIAFSKGSIIMICMQWFVALFISLVMDKVFNLIEVPDTMNSAVFIASFVMACVCLIPSRILVRNDEDRFWYKRAGVVVRISFYLMVGIFLVPMFPNLEPPPATP